MIKVIADGKEFQVEEGTRIVDFINSNGISHEMPILGAIINNVQVNLRHKLTEDCEISFIDYTLEEGVDIYR
jgi:sulfur carrier protein ThiS